MEANRAEILFKEKYGDSKERYYVKPSGMLRTNQYKDSCKKLFKDMSTKNY